MKLCPKKERKLETAHVVREKTVVDDVRRKREKRAKASAKRARSYLKCGE